MSEFLYHDDDEIVQVAMSIIIESGEARKALTKALDSISDFDFEQAKQFVSEANKHISNAHNVQTQRMQAEIAKEKPFKPSILFSHAQDTLMTTMSEIHLAEKLVIIFENFHAKFS